MLLLYIHLSIYVGEGFLWDNYTQYIVQRCDKWWTNALFVNNVLCNLSLLLFVLVFVLICYVCVCLTCFWLTFFLVAVLAHSVRRAVPGLVMVPCERHPILFRMPYYSLGLLQEPQAWLGAAAVPYCGQLGHHNLADVFL